MRTEQLQWRIGGWEKVGGESLAHEAELVLMFGSTALLKNKDLIKRAKDLYPTAHFVGCSTSGEIIDTHVSDETISLTAVKFQKTDLITRSIAISEAANSYDIGKALIHKFDPKGLKHVFVLSDGLNVNGSQLVQGMRDALPHGISVTGGLAGDGANFNETLIISDDAYPKSHMLTAIGFYSASLKVGYGSFGGWDSFGIERVVTKSVNNVLYELDGKPALELYKSFLGDQAKYLPSSGLLFPLSLRVENDQLPVVRTILSVNEADNSLVFAGDLPEGSYVRLMKANVDRLLDGAATAASTSIASLSGSNPELAILISCVGRKLVLKQMIEEEVEGVRSILGDKTAITGFYSYGEISPFSKNERCELHNQTMTITTFSEAA